MQAPPIAQPPAAAAADHKPVSDNTAATPQAISQPQAQVRPLAPTVVDGYAQRDDARQLATEIATQHSLDPEWVSLAMAQARYKESVTRFIMPPPAGTPKNWTAYRSRFVEPIRIRAGVQFWREHRDTLQRAEREFGVPAAVIVGVLGVETIYGRQMGNFRALDALTTLSLDFPKGRSDRSAFFKAELGQLLKWTHEQGGDPGTVMASYAGAIGMPQFMPSSIRRFAVDYDGDARIDLTRSPADAIGSVARYLAAHGWVQGSPGYFEVQVPADAETLQRLLVPDILPSFTAAELQAAGATLPNNAQSHAGKLALVSLQNGDGPMVYVLGTANFYAVTRYNQSSYYALAVLQLGDAVQRETERTAPTAK